MLPQVRLCGCTGRSEWPHVMLCEHESECVEAGQFKWPQAMLHESRSDCVNTGQTVKAGQTE